jgi:sodium-dependent dicarboxylate transporter 2/3/5
MSAAPEKAPVFHLLLGPALFLAALVVPFGMPYEARAAVGLLVWMAWWWVSAPVHLAVTALLPLVTAALFDFVSLDVVLPAYATNLIVLLLGANILAAAWIRWGLDRRIALTALLTVGTGKRRQILTWFAVAAALSAVLPNTIVAAAMMPIVVAMLRFIGVDDLRESSFGTALGLAVAWGTSVGGLATPLGGAPNLLTVDFIEESVTGREFLFLTWVTRMLPLTVTIAAISFLYMTRAFRGERGNVEGSREYFRKELQGLRAMSAPERWALSLFLAATAAAFTRELYASYLPSFEPSFAFLTFALLCFVLRPGGEPVLRWEFAQGKIVWGLLYLFAGGAALGRILSETGAAREVAELLVPYASGGGFLTVALFSLLAIGITQITSNTAAAAVTIPIAITTFEQAGLDPMPFVYIVAAAVNCGFALPSSAGGPAVSAGYGVNLRTMFTGGLVLAGLVWIAILLVGFALARWWPSFAAA